MTDLQSGGVALRQLYRRLSRNSIIVMSGTTVNAALVLGATAINARELGVASFGILVLMQTALTAITGVIGFGTQQPVIMLGSHARAEGSTDRLELIIGQGLALDLISAILAMTIAIVVVTFGSSLIGLSPDVRGQALIFAFAAGFSGFRTADGVLRLFSKFGLMSAIPVAVGSLQLAIAILFWQIDAPFGAYVWAYALFFIAPYQLQLCASLILLARRRLRPHISFAAERIPEWRIFIAYSIDTWLTSTIDTLRTTVDSILVGLYVSVSGAGIYHVAKQLSGILRKATSVYAAAFFPEVARLSAESRFDDAVKLLKNIVLVALTITIFSTCGTWLLGHFILETVFGPEFAAARMTLTIMVAAAGLMIISQSLAIYLQAFAGARYLTISYFFGMLGFIAVIIPASIGYKSEGAAASQLVFIIIVALCCVAFLKGRMMPRAETGS
jgi:O-antigen/teichoic acid export membrane protein